jgi:saccharopine dehydrogenase-like NADP-dependent oxidoreductase
MKQILLFGAGKSATVLIDYLLENANTENWHVTVVDANLELAKEKIGTSSHGTAVSFDINDEGTRKDHVQKADIVISLLPPALHFLVAKNCIQYKKNLLTASYVDEQMRSLQKEIEANGLLFLCEMGLDPGIDHMSAKKMIDEIHEEGGKVTSFLSHCGGLVAPESDDNPWHYKISWNPRNVVNAGKAGAIFKKDDEVVSLGYEQLFAEKRMVVVPDHEVLCWYPNRDSLSYIPTYGLEECATFIRTTLRHPDFIYGWHNIIELKLTDDEETYETDGLTLAQFFHQHLNKHGFGEWLQQKLQERFDSAKELLNNLMNLIQLEEKAKEAGENPVEDFMVVNDYGDLEQVDLDVLKTNAATVVADKMHESNATLKQLFYLGLDDNETIINKGKATAADVLQFVLERKLALQPSDKDLVVMLHEIEFEKDGKLFKRTSSFVATGKDAQHTAMAKTVGLPLGIAAKLILNGGIQLKGLHIPILPEIYNTVLPELEKHKIVFREETTVL